MRVLLDECLPSRLRRDLPGHDVLTVPRAGWAGIKNGKLLKLIADSDDFDVFLTMDKICRTGSNSNSCHLPSLFCAPNRIVLKTRIR